MTGWMWVIIALVIFAIIAAIVKNGEQKKVLAAIDERREEAEATIMKSGNTEAIKVLMEARADPSNYVTILSNGAKQGNGILKTATVFMMGAVAGNLIANAVSTAASPHTLAQGQTGFNDFNASSFDEADYDLSDFSEMGDYKDSYYESNDSNDGEGFEDYNDMGDYGDYE